MSHAEDERQKEEDSDDFAAIDSLVREVAQVSDPASPDHVEDLSGQTLGRFTIRARLGAGGMGVVYHAEDTTLRRAVALKVCPAALIASGERRRRFLREARAASAVVHPNITAVYEVGESAALVFIAMERVRGKTLRKVLQERGGRLPQGEALAVACAIARGLGKAHEAGIVHRDIKPENVMIADEGAVKILDFGLAKWLAPPEARALCPGTSSFATIEGRIMGTPSYMSPEQAEGKAVDTRTDIFSLGVVLYEMITGVRPFRGQTPMEVLIATSRDTPAKASQLAPETPRDLERLLQRCLEKRPEARFPTCGALIDAMDLLALPALGAPSRGSLRRRARGALLALIAGGLVAAGVAVAVAARRAPPAAPPLQPGPLVVEAVGCAPATLTGEGAQPEIARALGIAACDRLGVELGVPWGTKGAARALEVAADLRPDGARVTLSLGGRSAAADARTPIDAVAAAIPKLAAELTAPPMTPEEIQDWGARDEASARRLRRAWRRYEEGLLDDPLSEANRLLESDPESPWSHLLAAEVDPARAQGERSRAIEQIDRISPSRARGLRGAILLRAKSGAKLAAAEDLAALRQAHLERLGDEDLTIEYSKFIRDEERLALAEKLDDSSSPRAAVNVLGHIVADERASMENKQRSLERARAILPEIAAWEPSIDVQIAAGRLDEARAAIALGERLGLSDMAGSRASLAWVTLDPGAMRAAGIRMLGDRRASARSRGDVLIVAAHLMEGRIALAEAALVERFERRRGALQVYEAADCFLDELWLRRWLDRPLREAERLGWVERALRERWAQIGVDLRHLLEVGLPFARAGSKPDRAAAERALAAVESATTKDAEGLELSRQQQRALTIPLLRVARGDAEAARQWREIHRTVRAMSPMPALDVALLLEATSARKEAEEMYRMAMDTRFVSKTLSMDAFAMIAARVRLAALYRSEGRLAEARALDAVVDRVWAGADPGLRDAVLAMK